jgi:hypothetical protein
MEGESRWILNWKVGRVGVGGCGGGGTACIIYIYLDKLLLFLCV